IQGDDSNLNNLTFRFKRYPSDYEAFDGKDLTPQGFIELNPDDTFCDFLVNTRSDYQIYDKSNRLQVFPNPASSVLQIQNNLKQSTQIYIYNALGQLMHQCLIIESTSLDLSDWPSGTYWLRQENGQTSSFLIQK
ncbi:MAG: T9SS type A sorting domain-containing protein, partial [Saprospiraceae bacterium]|nr:T9SS type A sorting domain-containing protein [Saprospiraceae bacterium]